MGESRSGDLVPVPHRNRLPSLAPPPPQDDLNPRWAGFFGRRWKSITFGLISVAAACAVVTLLLPKTYTSEALVFVEQRESSGSSSALNVLERLGSGNRVDTELELIHSRPVVEHVVDAADLNVSFEADGRAIDPGELFTSFDATPDATPGMFEFAVTGVPTAEETDRESVLVGRGLVAERRTDAAFDRVVATVLPFQQAVDEALERISVGKVQRDASLLRLTCSGRSPEAAADLCRQVLASYFTLRTELQRSDATVAASFLREQIDRIGVELRAAEDALEAFGREEGAVALDERASEQVRSLARLKEQRDELAAERSSVRSLLARIEKDERGSRKYRDLASIPKLLDNDLITGLLVNLMELENRRSDLLLRRAPTNVDILAIDQRIVEIELQLKSVATSYDDALAAKVRSLDGTLSASRERLAALPAQQTKAGQLQRDYDLLNNLYRTLESRLHEAEVAKGITMPGVRIVGHPSIPFKAASPSLPMNMALGLMLGSVYGIGLGLLRETRDKTLRSRREVESHTGLPVLGMLPHLKRPGPVVAVQHSDHGPVDADGLIGRELPEPSDEVATALAREAFRSLVVDVGFAGGPANGGVRSVAVTSAHRAEGKTFTACNLALVKAAHGARVLLIDGDMRASGVAHFFNLPPATAGLSDVLTEDVSVVNLLHPLKVGSDSEMWVLPAGRPTHDASSLVDSERFRLLVSRAAAKFDFVVVDCPPLNVITDAASVSAAVDGVLLVVREGTTDRESIDLTLSRLHRTHANALGAVLNDVRPSSRHDRRYYEQYTREGRE